MTKADFVSFSASLSSSLIFVLILIFTILWIIAQVNKEIVKIQRVTAPVGQMQLKSLIEAHVVSSTYILSNNNPEEHEKIIVDFLHKRTTCWPVSKPD